MRSAVLGAVSEPYVCQCEEVTAREILEVRPPRYLQAKPDRRNTRELSSLLGNGPLSPRVETFGSMPLQMTYQRVLRRTAPSQIEIRTTAPLPDDQLEVELPNALATDMDVVATSPRAAALRAERDGLVYTFALGASRQGTITFTVKPRSAGLVRSVVKSGAAEGMLRQVVLP